MIDQGFDEKSTNFPSSKSFYFVLYNNLSVEYLSNPIKYRMISQDNKDIFKRKREFYLDEDLVDKIDSIEYGAQVNKIEEIEEKIRRIAAEEMEKNSKDSGGDEDIEIETPIKKTVQKIPSFFINRKHICYKNFTYFLFYFLSH